MESPALKFPRIRSQDLQIPPVEFTAYLGFQHPENRQQIHSLPFLGVNLQAQPILNLRESIAREIKRDLRGYPEAHITILSPPEITQFFPNDSIAEISKWAANHQIQTIPFTVIGLGKASLSVSADSPNFETFFLVIESPEILAFRQQLFEKYATRKKAPESPFEPHITVGFTTRDLHSQDGASKGRQSLLVNWSKGS